LTTSTTCIQYSIFIRITTTPKATDTIWAISTSSGTTTSEEHLSVNYLPV
jgi:hypothetical protein